MTAMEIFKTTRIQVPGLGERIKEAREADARPLTEIAELAGMRSMNWYRIEKETQALPVETLRKIEAVLGVDFGVEL